MPPRETPPDGRGKESVSDMKVESRYIYYRLYTRQGALESNNLIYSDDPLIGRITSKSVTPPHTGTSLKKRICCVEGLKASTECDLYLSLSETTHLKDDTTRIQFLGTAPGPGSSEFDPIALVIDIWAAEERSPAANTVDSEELPKWQGEQRFIYYRIFDENGETASKTSFNEADVTFGRLNVLSISPPHLSCTGASLKSRLIQVEGVVDPEVKLLKDEGGDETIEDCDSIALLSDACPGLFEEAPLAFVHEPHQTSSDLEPVPVLGFFLRRLKATSKCDEGCNDGYSRATWHRAESGEIFETDGVLKRETYIVRRSGYNYHSHGEQYSYSEEDCYEAINSSGKRAFLPSSELPSRQLSQHTFNTDTPGLLEYSTFY